MTLKTGEVNFPIHFDPLPHDVTIDDFVWNPEYDRFDIINQNQGFCDAKYATFKDVIIDKCDVIDDSNNPFDGVKYYKIIERSWTVWDASGNEAYCTETIYLESGELGDEEESHIECPPNFDDIDMPAFRCPDEYAGYELPNGAPSPAVTGYPFDYRTPDHTLCPNIQVTFDDLIITICPNSFKVVRNWDDIGLVYGRSKNRLQPGHQSCG